MPIPAGTKSVTTSTAVPSGHLPTCPPTDNNSLGQSLMPSRNPSSLDTPLEDVLKCQKCGKCFGGDRRCRQGNLNRHNASYHKKKVWHCPEQGCVKFYKRSDTLQDHRRKHHPELGLSPPISRRRSSNDG